ncbi:hypothetical protein BKA93DRAFT_451100 [Sparassis latifolia]
MVGSKTYMKDSRSLRPTRRRCHDVTDAPARAGGHTKRVCTYNTDLAPRPKFTPSRCPPAPPAMLRSAYILTSLPVPSSPPPKFTPSRYPPHINLRRTRAIRHDNSHRLRTATRLGAQRPHFGGVVRSAGTQGTLGDVCGLDRDAWVFDRWVSVRVRVVLEPAAGGVVANSTVIALRTRTPRRGRRYRRKNRDDQWFGTSGTRLQSERGGMVRRPVIGSRASSI